MRCHFTPTKMLIIKKPTAISVNKNIKRVTVTIVTLMDCWKFKML